MVDCKLIVAMELASTGEDDDGFVATLGAAEEVAGVEDWLT